MHLLYTLFLYHMNRCCEKSGILWKIKIENIRLNKVKDVSLRGKFFMCFALNVFGLPQKVESISLEVTCHMVNDLINVYK